MLTRFLGAVAVTLAAAASLTLAAPAQAAACSGTTGVTVVVDFGSSQITGCALGDPATGLEALRGAGFSYAFHPREPGFVCKINGAPASGDCLKPNYWSYWHKSGTSWAYSSVGAGSYNPAPGATEGWAFTGSNPATAPNGAAGNGIRTTSRPKPKPAASKSPAPAAAPKTVAPAHASPSPRPAAAKPSAAAKKAHKPRKKKAAASVSASPVAVSSATAVYQPETEQPRQPENGTVSWWWGALGVGALAGTAGAVGLIRRRGV